MDVGVEWEHCKEIPHIGDIQQQKVQKEGEHPVVQATYFWFTEAGFARLMRRCGVEGNARQP